MKRLLLSHENILIIHYKQTPHSPCSYSPNPITIQSTMYTHNCSLRDNNIKYRASIIMQLWKDCDLGCLDFKFQEPITNCLPLQYLLNYSWRYGTRITYNPCIIVINQFSNRFNIYSTSFVILGPIIWNQLKSESIITGSFRGVFNKYLLYIEPDT